MGVPEGSGAGATAGSVAGDSAEESATGGVGLFVGLVGLDGLRGAGGVRVRSPLTSLEGAAVCSSETKSHILQPSHDNCCNVLMSKS